MHSARPSSAPFCSTSRASCYAAGSSSSRLMTARRNCTMVRLVPYRYFPSFGEVQLWGSTLPCYIEPHAFYLVNFSNAWPLRIVLCVLDWEETEFSLGGLLLVGPFGDSWDYCAICSFPILHPVGVLVCGPILGVFLFTPPASSCTWLCSDRHFPPHSAAGLDFFI